MKKVISLALCLLLTLPFFTATAEMPGETVEISFSLTSDIGDIPLIVVKLEYDHEALECLAIAGRDDTYTPAIAPRGFTAVFRILENARPGAYPVNVKVIDTSDVDGNELRKEQIPIYSEAMITVKHLPVDVSVYYVYNGALLSSQTVTLPAGEESTVEADIPKGYVAIGQPSMKVSVAEDGKAVPEAVTFMLATPAPTPVPTPKPEDRSQTDRNALIMKALAAAGLAWPMDEASLAAAKNAAPDWARFLYVAFPGDLNNDQRTDVRDKELMEKYVQSLSIGAEGNSAPDEGGIERLMNGDLDSDGLVTAEDQTVLDDRLENLLSSNAVTRDSFIMARLKEEGLSWPLTQEELSSVLARLPWLNGYLYVGLKGDMNGDGTVKIGDYRILENALQGIDKGNLKCYGNGDMDGDGEVTSADLVLLLKKIEQSGMVRIRTDFFGS